MATSFWYCPTRLTWSNNYNNMNVSLCGSTEAHTIQSVQFRKLFVARFTLSVHCPDWFWSIIPSSAFCSFAMKLCTASLERAGTVMANNRWNTACLKASGENTGDCCGSITTSCRWYSPAAIYNQGVGIKTSEGTIESPSHLTWYKSDEANIFADKVHVLEKRLKNGKINRVMKFFSSNFQESTTRLERITVIRNELCRSNSYSFHSCTSVRRAYIIHMDNRSCRNLMRHWLIGWLRQRSCSAEKYSVCFWNILFGRIFLLTDLLFFFKIWFRWFIYSLGWLSVLVATDSIDGIWELRCIYRSSYST